MAQAPSPCGGTRAAQSFLEATLELLRPCPAQPEYIELCFTTPDGDFTWCFPEPPRHPRQPDGPIALAMGPYGVQAREICDGDLGLALDSATALPSIIGGAEVHIARKLLLRAPVAPARRSRRPRRPTRSARRS